MTQPPGFLERLRANFSHVGEKEARRIRAGGLALYSSMALVSFLPGAEHSTLAQVMASLGINIASSAIVELLAVPADEVDPVALAEALDPEIQADPELREELVQFLNEYQVWNLAKGI